MSIDEAITHAREVAERNRKQYKNCPSDRTDIRYQTCEECAEEHEQLAEWLEELKVYREIGTVEECKNSVLDIERAYNKAIDDFVKLVYKHDWNIRNRNENSFIYGAIDTLAEQLKAGGSGAGSI